MSTETQRHGELLAGQALLVGETYFSVETHILGMLKVKHLIGFLCLEIFFWQEAEPTSHCKSPEADPDSGSG